MYRIFYSYAIYKGLLLLSYVLIYLYLYLSMYKYLFSFFVNMWNYLKALGAGLACRGLGGVGQGIGSMFRTLTSRCIPLLLHITVIFLFYYSAEYKDTLWRTFVLFFTCLFQVIIMHYFFLSDTFINLNLYFDLYSDVTFYGSDSDIYLAGHSWFNSVISFWTWLLDMFFPKHIEEPSSYYGKFTDDIVWQYGDYKTIIGFFKDRNLDTSNMLTSNMDISNIDTRNLQTCNILTSHMDTSNMNTSNMNTSNLNTSNLNTSNLITSHLNVRNIDTSYIPSSNILTININTSLINLRTITIPIPLRTLDASEIVQTNGTGGIVDLVIRGELNLYVVDDGMGRIYTDSNILKNLHNQGVNIPHEPKKSFFYNDNAKRDSEFKKKAAKWCNIIITVEFDKVLLVHDRDALTCDKILCTSYDEKIYSIITHSTHSIRQLNSSVPLLEAPIELAACADVLNKGDKLPIVLRK